MTTVNIKCGKYRHYKNKKLYEVIGMARHSETHEEMVIYKVLYNCDKYGENQLWARPKEMFSENVVYNGNSIPRFTLIEEDDV